MAAGFDLSAYTVSEERLALFDDPDMLIEKIEEGESLQGLLGFSDAVMREFYELASNFFEEGNYEDALCAFLFLSTVNAGVPEFWLALGLSNEKLLKYSEAAEAYTMAAVLKETDIEMYQRALECCLMSEFPDQAGNILQLAEEVARDEDKTSSEFEEGVLALRDRLSLD